MILQENQGENHIYLDWKTPNLASLHPAARKLYNVYEMLVKRRFQVYILEK